MGQWVVSGGGAMGQSDKPSFLRDPHLGSTQACILWTPIKGAVSKQKRTFCTLDSRVAVVTI